MKVVILLISISLAMVEAKLWYSSKNMYMQKFAGVRNIASLSFSIESSDSKLRSSSQDKKSI